MELHTVILIEALKQHKGMSHSEATAYALIGLPSSYEKGGPFYGYQFPISPRLAYTLIEGTKFSEVL